MWRRGLAVITTIEAVSVKPKFRFYAGSDPARGVS